LRLSRSELNLRVLAALKDNVTWHSGLGSKPFEFDINLDSSQRYRSYLYNATLSQRGRALGERKIQIKLPRQSMDIRGNFDHSDNRMALLIGYEAEMDIFILWDAGTYREFPFNMNVQVAPETIFAAFSSGLALQNRIRRTPTLVEEVVVCAASEFLPRALDLRVKLSLERITKNR